MRCKACNKELSDSESVRKSKVTNEYYDLCTICYSHVQDSMWWNSEKDEKEDLTSVKRSL